MPDANTIRKCVAATSLPQGGQAARDIFRRGGNAVDAAAAAVCALSVVNPGAVGFGGYGGSMVAHVGGGKAVAIDFDARAPIAFQRELFPDKTTRETGYLAVTVPGVVAGLELAVRKFGKLKFSDVLGPALDLAENGFEVDAKLHGLLKGFQKKADPASFKAQFPTGKIPGVGERWVQTDLARMLRRLADEGAAAMYRGEIPRQIVRQVHDHGGILSEEDFESYEASVVEPVTIQWRGYELFTPPPPSGGITSVQILKALEQFDVKAMQPFGATYLHTLAEVTKACWQDREKYLGDPDVVKVPIADMLSDRRAAEIAAMVRERAGPSAPAKEAGGRHTVNVLTADRDGNVCSMTATQGNMYGAHVCIEGLGLVLGHGMSRFTYDPPDSPNAPAPRKRMHHNMSPLVATRDGRAQFAVGMPGGERIVNGTAQITAGLVEFGLTPREAVTAARLHTTGEEPLTVTNDVPKAVLEQLEAMGHKIARVESVGGPSNALTLNWETGDALAACDNDQRGVVSVE